MGFVKRTTYYRDTVYEWNLPSGWSCPFARECLVKVNSETGKMDNRSTTYKCYSSQAERFPSVRNVRWENWEQIKAGGIPPLPPDAKAVRIHGSGDFYSQKYFDLWIDYCGRYPDIEFWAFTKSLRYWVARIDSLPKNLAMTASVGGKEDHLITLHNLRWCKVISHKDEARGLPIDTNDDYARKPHGNFYLLDNFTPKPKKEKAGVLKLWKDEL